MVRRIFIVEIKNLIYTFTRRLRLPLTLNNSEHIRQSCITYSFMIEMVVIKTNNNKDSYLDNSGDVINE